MRDLCSIPLPLQGTFFNNVPHRCAAAKPQATQRILYCYGYSITITTLQLLSTPSPPLHKIAKFFCAHQGIDETTENLGYEWPGKTHEAHKTRCCSTIASSIALICPTRWIWSLTYRMVGPVVAWRKYFG